MIHTDYAYGPGRYRRRRGLSNDVYVSEFEQGTLLLDVLSADGKKLLGRGAASARVDEGATPEERSERVNEAVRKLIEGFPPSPGSV